MPRYKLIAGNPGEKPKKVQFTAAEEKIRDAEEAQGAIDAAADLIVEARFDRDTMLAATDWVITKAFETSTAVPAKWSTYRQALRDVPLQTGWPTNIVWPTKPI